MTKSKYYSGIDQHIVDDFTEEEKNNEITTEEIVIELQESFKNFVYSRNLDQDIMLDLEDELISKGLKKTLEENRYVDIEEVFSMDQYLEQEEENEKARKDYAEFVRIESASYNFM